MFGLAGLTPGMRVLDIGCGAGDVSFLALSLVGPGATVIGVDRSPEAVAVARQRAQQAGIPNVQFIATDLDQLELDQPVDALIGRLVLMYFREPGAVLRRLRRFVKPGGLVTFQEIDATGVAAEPMCDEFWTAGQRINQTFVRAGIDLRTGLKLPAIFREAGLPVPKTLQMARVEHGPDAQGYAWVAELTRTLLPVMERTGVATAEEIGLDSLASRIRDEAVRKNAVLVMPPLIGAWAHNPNA
ncbi:MAG TPA: class I SAM-dependent methyltransferase [Vicinamibacterales bacterium]|nr:class I SAM-dependent methyltransferase [Vicinamibacterales bacterium]